MNKKIGRVPTEEDTRILYRKEVKIGDYDVVHERWNWEGIKAESFIFANDDISGLTDEKIEQEVRKSQLFKGESQITLKRTKEFTFVNFNFETT